MDVRFWDWILWGIGSLVAVGILFGLMRRRRDQLVETLREHVDQQQSKPRPPSQPNE